MKNNAGSNPAFPKFHQGICMNKTKYMNEGVVFKSPAFVFDFEHDNEDDVIKLTGKLKSSNVYGNTYFFQYEFGDDIPSVLRSKFIHVLKFDSRQLGEANVNMFIDNAMTNLNKAVNLANVDIVIYPQSSSTLTKDIVDRLDSFTDSERYIKLEVVKKAVNEINFNWEKFEKYCENHDVPSNAREVMKKKMLKMLDDIHALDYFSIAKNIKDQKYKKFLSTIYKFYDDQSIELVKTIKNKKILIVDDIYTSGVTIEQIIKTYQMLDPDESNVLSVFTLIGKSKSI